MNSIKTLNPVFSIHAFKQGQPRAFNHVFDLYYHALHFFANRLIQDASAAEDITQETFIKLWEKHAGFHSPEAIKSFLYITTRNACFNYIKRAKTQAKNQKLWSHVWDESDDFVLNHLTRAEAIREIYITLEMLPTECRKVMRLYFIEGKENEEIARLLNISIHTVRNQKARAVYLIRKKLRKKSFLFVMLLLLELRSLKTDKRPPRLLNISVVSPPAKLSPFDVATTSNFGTAKGQTQDEMCRLHTAAN